MHKHHINQRHLGGTNDPDNLVEVTVEEHAEIHRCLWVYGGREQDKIAWLSLTKQITSDEARRLATTLKLKGVPKSEEHKQNQRGPRGPQANMKGRVGRKKGYKLTKEHKQKLRGPRGPQANMRGPKPNMKNKPWSQRRREAQQKRNGKKN